LIFALLPLLFKLLNIKLQNANHIFFALLCFGFIEDVNTSRKAFLLYKLKMREKQKERKT